MPKLTDCAEQALSWVEDNRAHFSPREHATTASEQVILLKPLSELVLTVSLLSRHPGLQERCLPLLEWAWDEVQRGRYLLELTSARPELIETVGLYASIRELGVHNDRLEVWLREIVQSALFDGLELPAWRRTALHYNLARLGLVDPPTRSVSGSWLAALPEPWTISDTTGYPMTHEVFYLTDFGRQRDAVTPEVADYLALWLPAWWRCSLAVGNHDLAAEMIMTGACIGLPGSSEALGTLASLQQADGRLPGPEGAGGDLPCPSGDRVRGGFLQSYHSTLVALLAMTTDRWSIPATAAELRAPQGDR